MASTADGLRYQVSRAIAREMAQLYGEWEVTEGGVTGPGGTAVVVEAGHIEGKPEVVRIGFVMERERPDSEMIWDHVHGIGSSVEEALDRAAMTWAQTTGATIIELFLRRNEFGAHYGPDHPNGLPGHHVVHGPAIAWGLVNDDALQQWLMDNSVLPALALTIAPAINRPNWNGIRLLFGGVAGDEISEVQVNEEVVPAAGQALAGLNWPRLSRPVFARAFLLAHPV
ncbi:DUF6348 family protein [Nocardia sp. NPDC006044]|uniref:DUF6348 family protein n=1 Tax=Nocardia sp. NPDC006044 TaxID=3364306 RepID=UPI0036C08564